jgi:hypothetical protein
LSEEERSRVMAELPRRLAVLETDSRAKAEPA